MIKERFLRDSAVYKRFVGDSSVGDSSDGSAKYDEFSLTHVLVQRKSLINKSGERCAAELYSTSSPNSALAQRMELYLPCRRPRRTTDV